MAKTEFQLALLHWYERHKRTLPWRKTDDPYRIWLSEIILQQTRVAQGMPYYQKFVKNYPTVQDLAAAPEDRVLKDWEGLGYYSRARNMHKASREIAENREGTFPSKYEDILSLKGVGEYTAAAISSFAFGGAHAVLDGNVFRVLARYLGIDAPINTGKGKKEFQALAEKMLDKENPADYNQAIMEFGALQCVPKNPDCGICPLQSSCTAFTTGKVDQLPVKEKKKYDRQRYFFYILFTKDGKLWVNQRQAKDIWKGLYQFYPMERPAPTEVKEIMGEVMSMAGGAESSLVLKTVHGLKPHKLSHQSIHISILEVAVRNGPDFLKEEGGRWVNARELEGLALPRPLRAFLDRNQLTLPL